jgi:hypothetical protein
MGALLALLCSAPALRAQTAEPARVELTGDDPRLRFEIYSLANRANRDVRIHTCGNPCRVLLPHGEYRVHVTGDPENIEGDRTIEVTGHGSWRFSLPDRSDKSGGLAVAITGTVLIPAGLGVAYLAATSGCGHDCYGKERRNDGADIGVVVGLGMTVIGAILTPIGWSQFARNRKPKLEEPPRAARSRRAPRIGVGAAPVPGGATAALWGRF